MARRSLILDDPTAPRGASPPATPEPTPKAEDRREDRADKSEPKKRREKRSQASRPAKEAPSSLKPQEALTRDVYGRIPEAVARKLDYAQLDIAPQSVGPRQGLVLGLVDRHVPSAGEQGSKLLAMIAEYRLAFEPRGRYEKRALFVKMPEELARRLDRFIVDVRPELTPRVSRQEVIGALLWLGLADEPAGLVEQLYAA